MPEPTKAAVGMPKPIDNQIIVTADGIYVTPETMAKLREQLPAEQPPAWDRRWMYSRPIYLLPSPPAPRRTWWKRALAWLARAGRIGRR